MSNLFGIIGGTPVCEWFEQIKDGICELSTLQCTKWLSPCYHMENCDKSCVTDPDQQVVAAAQHTRCSCDNISAVLYKCACLFPTLDFSLTVQVLISTRSSS